MPVNFTSKIDPKRHRPSLTPQQAESYTEGAITYEFLKRDRAESAANGTNPLIPFYRLGYRTVKYSPSDLDAFLDGRRVE